MITIYVDVDGTLIKYRTARFTIAVDRGVNNGQTHLDAWIDATQVIPRPLNLRLLRWLRSLPRDKYRVVLWTNRNPALEAATMKNLGKWTKVFDGFSFNGTAGQEANKYGLMDGFVIDDEPRYVKCGALGGVQIIW